MQILFLTLGAFFGYLNMWMIVARWHYRWWWTSKIPHLPYFREDADRRMKSGFVGMFWPLTWIWLGLYGLTALIGWAETTPSLRERKAKRVEAKKVKLADLNRQIEHAETELCEATEVLKRAQAEGTPLTKYGAGIDITPR